MTNTGTFFRLVMLPLLHLLDPETSHRVSLWALRHKLLADKGNLHSEMLVSQST